MHGLLVRCWMMELLGCWLVAKAARFDSTNKPMSECLCERERQPDGFALVSSTNRLSVKNPSENMNSSVRRQPPARVGDRQTNPLECVERIRLSSNEFTGTIEIRLSVFPVRIAICLTSPNPKQLTDSVVQQLLLAVGRTKSSDVPC